MECVWCKAQVNAGAAVCAGCGRDQQRRCTTCAEWMPANLDKCPKCKSGKGLSPLVMIVLLMVGLGVAAALLQAIAAK